MHVTTSESDWLYYVIELSEIGFHQGTKNNLLFYIKVFTNLF